MHRSNAELQWYLRHEWERRLRRADWGTGRTVPVRPRSREELR